MTLQERLTTAYDAENRRRQAAGEPRLTKTNIWKAAKVSSGAATHWFDGSNGMDLDTCELVAPLLRVSPRWLFDESVPMAQQSQSQSQVPNLSPPVTHDDGLDHSAYTGNQVGGAESHPLSGVKTYPAGIGRPVWVIGNGNGGLPDRVWDDQGYPVGASDEFANIATEDEHAFIVRVRGDSMVPKYRPGEFALVEPSTYPDVGDDVLVRLVTGETIIKTLASRSGGGIRLSSYNSRAEQFYRDDEVSWVYWVPHPVPAKKIRTRS